LNQSNQSSGSIPSLITWDPKRYLSKVDYTTAALSRGFLRCKPEGWFPGFASQWIPLAHSIGCEIKILELKPVISITNDPFIGYSGSFDGEPMAILIDKASKSVIAEALVPEASGKASDVVVEYAARRLLGSIALSWSGGESATIRYEPTIDPFSISISGAIKITLMLNGKQCRILLCLGKNIIQKLDGLWRRQLHTSSRTYIPNEGNLHVEIAQLAVPPSQLGDYLKSGTIVDLEIALTDAVSVRHGLKHLIAAKLCSVNDKFGIETLSIPVSNPILPEGTTRVSIEVFKMHSDPASTLELLQPGAVLVSEVDVSDYVEMTINGEKVATASLKSYEGRFAIVVN
jgi:hypothetical protein